MPRIISGKDTSIEYPVIPLRNALMVPYVISPILVGRAASLDALETAYLGDKTVVCVTQKANLQNEDDPSAKDLNRYGTICNVLQIFRMPDGNVRALIEGKERIQVERFKRTKKMLKAQVLPAGFFLSGIDHEMEALIRSLKKSFEEYVHLSRTIPEESLIPLNEIDKPEEFFYFVLTNLDKDLKSKQRLFELDDFHQAVSELHELLVNEIEILKLEKNIDIKVKGKLGKLQREYYLHEQLKIIHKELGISEEEQEDLIRFRQLLEETPLNEEAGKRAQEEIKRLSRLTHHAQEYSVVYHYLSWIFDLPWKKPEQAKIDLANARRILDEDHYGLDKIKERILEYLAVIKLAGASKGQILCFVGPPGVGKTSLGKSIARALDRKFVRLSLGGVRDEAEIRGHRRTYIGALPGVIIQSMKKAGTMNPLIMMDEVDKMSVDFRGDPSAALLEVLDAEQNHEFRDHYLDFGYDLSKVLFITTANQLGPIPKPLMDRMEIIHLPGYTSIEKYNIAEKHLVPKQIAEHNLENHFDIRFERKTLTGIIENYTREAGVRSLERKIATVIRKVVRSYLETRKKSKYIIKPGSLTNWLGVPKYLYPEIDKKPQVGIVTGLAWTAAGGEILQIEVIKMPGEGKVILTGKLGDVMKESAQAALSYARLHSDEYGIDPECHKKCDLHLHIPEGAIPKDGPSAGITMTTAIVSALSGIEVDCNLAMTGEITLSGKVLPIGGLEEKLIAARQAGINRVIVPRKNEPHVSEIKPEVLEGMKIHFVDSLKEVLDLALIKK